MVEPFLPNGLRVYSIGDIHGRLDLLCQLHELIQLDAAQYQGDKTLVYLGDYIDRGGQSKEVIDCLLSAPMPEFTTVHLLGNHEQVLLDFLQYPKQAGSWLQFGGVETLRSYGVGVHPEDPRQSMEDLKDDLQNSLPESHLKFLKSLQLLHKVGSYCFVHAGIRPGVPLQEQRNADLLWIRDDFTRSDENHEMIVVHGHTIAREVEFLPNRIGIDTGAFHSGILTALVLEGSSQRLLQTGQSEC